MAKRTWLQSVVDFAGNGVVVDGNKRKAFPVKKEGKWTYGKCPRCGNEHGVVFFTEDKQYYVLFCMRCKRYSYVKVGEKEAKMPDVRCVAKTKKGYRCKNNAEPGSFICGSHYKVLMNGNSLYHYKSDKKIATKPKQLVDINESKRDY